MSDLNEKTQNSTDNAEDTMNKETLDNTETVESAETAKFGTANAEASQDKASKIEAADAASVETESDTTESDAADADAVESDTAKSDTEDINNLPFNFVFDDAADDEISMADDTVNAIGGETAGVNAAAEGITNNAADEADESDEGSENGDVSSSVAADNAMKVNETLALQRDDDAFEHAAKGEKEPVSNAVTDAAATSVSTRLDREIRSSRDYALKANPTLALEHVTVKNAKTGRAVLDDVSLAFHKGGTYAMLATEDDLETRQAMLGVLTGMILPDSGNVISKSVNLRELEPLEVLAHRIGFIPQQYAVRADLDAESNILYAMDASNRNFLKPKPVIARELLKKVGFEGATSGVSIGELSAIEQYRVAVARALACEAEVIIADEPTAAFEDDEAGASDAATVLDLLTGLKRDDDGKRCIIIVTDRESVANAMETVYEL